ncbi:MAG: hypothetical protein ACR2H5_07815 [Ktedonobacteraceae bacterium]
MLAVERRGIREVELCLVGRREPPWVRAHEFGVGIDIEFERSGVGYSERQPELYGPSPIRDEIGAADLHAARRWQGHLIIAEA